MITNKDIKHDLLLIIITILFFLFATGIGLSETPTKEDIIITS